MKRAMLETCPLQDEGKAACLFCVGGLCTHNDSRSSLYQICHLILSAGMAG